MKASSLFNLFGRQMPPMNSGFANMMTQFNQFKQNFQGDPKQQVQQLLNSGRVTQEQYNRAVQMANALQKMLGR